MRWCKAAVEESMPQGLNRLRKNSMKVQNGVIGNQSGHGKVSRNSNGSLVGLPTEAGFPETEFFRSL